MYYASSVWLFPTLWFRGLSSHYLIFKRLQLTSIQRCFGLLFWITMGYVTMLNVSIKLNQLVIKYSMTSAMFRQTGRIQFPDMFGKAKIKHNFFFF